MKESQHEHHIEKDPFKGLVDFECEKFNWSSMLIY